MKKILVIDDDNFFPKTLEGFLPPDKYQMIAASDGEDGLAKVESEHPDLIILDIMMPNLDGEGFLRKLKESKKHHAIPVIITSNLSSEKKMHDMVTLGVEGYIVKSDESLASIAEDIERIISKTK